MKRVLRSVTITAAAVMFMIGGLAVEGRSQGIMYEILKRLDQNNKSLQSLTASVKMAKTNAQLGDTDITEGNTSYLTKTAIRYIRIDWTKPVEEKIAVIGDDYQLYRPRLNQVITGRVKKAKNNASVGGALAFMSMSKAQLQANYEAIYLGQEQVGASVQTWHLELIPKTATSYKSAEIWVDGNGMPVQAKIVEHNSDSTTVLLSSIVKNPNIKASIFTIALPKGVKVVKG